MEQDVCHHLGSSYDGALGLVESAGVVFDVAHLPHQCRDPPEAEQQQQHMNLKSTRPWYNGAGEVVSGAPPVETVVQPSADGADVGGVRHHGAVQRVVPQIHGQRKGLRYICGQAGESRSEAETIRLKQSGFSSRRVVPSVRS